MFRSLILIVLCSLLCQQGQATAVFASAVEIREGFIVLQATLNGVEGHYILDSGAPGIVLNRKYFNSDVEARSDQLEGVNGSVETHVVPDWHLIWNNFETSGKEAYAIDLSYLEDAVDLRIDGLLGLELFEDYHVLIDYSNASLELWTTVPEVFSRQPWVELPLEFHNHVPFVVLMHNQKSYRFALDSGSRSHLVDSNASKSWGTSVSILNPIELVGANQQIIETHKIQVSGLHASGIALPPTEFVLTDLSVLERITGHRIDGVIGLPFFAGRYVLIDKERKSLRLSAKVTRPEEEAFTASY